MANSGVRKVQQKIFGTGAGEGLGDGNDSQPGGRYESGPSQEQASSPAVGAGGQGPGLTVIIPKPKAPPTPPPRKTTSDTPPVVAAKQKGPEDDEDADGGGGTREGGQGSSIPFRDRLASKLGGDYDGAERYRLRQDDKREKHWKRWGPYLSDRQWVGVFLLRPAMRISS